MKTDRYTKSVLTVIAAALTVIAIRGFDLMPAAQAQNGSDQVLKVIICDDFFDTRCASVDARGRLEVTAGP